jgi:hypothetical protein
MQKILSLAFVTAMLFTAPVYAQDTTPVADVAIPDVAIEMREATLKDGTKISIEGENIFIVSDDGTKSLVPDGAHTMADGTTLTTKGGKLLGE